MNNESEFIECYDRVNTRNHDFEHIVGIFTFNELFSEKFRDEVDWINFRNFITEDFKRLPYTPCQITVGFDEIFVFWYFPKEYLINPLNVDEIQTIIKNIENQLRILIVCKKKELYVSGGDFEIPKDLYFENYYRKKQFDKLLLEK